MKRFFSFAMCVALIGLVVAHGVATAVAEPPQSPADTDSEQNIAELIRQLDSDRYIEREEAMHELVRLGAASLDALAKGADGEQLEVAARSVQALQQIASSEDAKLRLAALEQLAHLKNHRDARREARKELADYWEQTSLPIVLEKGGRFDMNREYVHVFPDPHTKRPRSSKLILGTAWKGSNEDLKHVARVRYVQTLSIRMVDVTVEDLELLTEMPDLAKLELFGTKVHHDELAAVLEKLPQIQIVDIRKGAMLGVRGSIAQAAAIIARVEPGSAAEKAGLKSADIITAVDDQEVANFSELTALIGQHDAGDTVKLTLLRSGERLEKEVTFGSWD